MRSREHLPERENEESQEYSSRITLSILRHGKKEAKDQAANPKDPLLTEEGRKEAVAASSRYKEDDNIDQSVALGSPRTRAQETAGLVMSGQKDEITGDENIEELRAKLDKELKVGSKIGKDKKLDFTFKEEILAKVMDAIKEKEHMKFMVEESDQMAQKINDKESDTYLRTASRVAQIVEKYLKVASRWDKLVQDESKEYQKELERILGTHAGVGECFLAKAIEKIAGKSERNKFLEAIDNNSFVETEGFQIEIDSFGEDEKPKVRVKYKKEDDSGKSVYEFNQVIPEETIKEVIEEGKI